MTTWTAAENDLLRSLVATTTDSKGRPMWTTIIKHLPGRSAQEARCRWSRIRARFPKELGGAEIALPPPRQFKEKKTANPPPPPLPSLGPAPPSAHPVPKAPSAKLPRAAPSKAPSTMIKAAAKAAAAAEWGGGAGGAGVLAAVASIVLAAGRDEDDTAVEPSRDALASRGDAQFNGRWDGASQGASPLSSERDSPTQQHQSGDIDLESESTAAMLRSLSPPPADMLGRASGGGHSFTRRFGRLDA